MITFMTPSWTEHNTRLFDVSRGVGCILFEMATGRPMFPGATVKEELHLIFRLLGKTAENTPVG